MMTKKHFRMIADAINFAVTETLHSETGQSERAALKRAANEIAGGCKLDNPNFRHDQFMTACGF